MELEFLKTFLILLVKSVIVLFSIVQAELFFYRLFLVGFYSNKDLFSSNLLSFIALSLSTCLFILVLFFFFIILIFSFFPPRLIILSFFSKGHLLTFLKPPFFAGLILPSHFPSLLFSFYLLSFLL